MKYVYCVIFNYSDSEGGGDELSGIYDNAKEAIKHAKNIVNKKIQKNPVMNFEEMESDYIFFLKLDSGTELYSEAIRVEKFKVHSIFNNITMEEG